MRLDVLHGPNLHLLGRRETSLYGTMTLQELNARCVEWAAARQVDLVVAQFNDEASILEAIVAASDAGSAGLALNAGAYTHTSIAIRDALLAVQLPFVEVHLSNVFAREPFRHHSTLSDVACGVVSGLGVHGYLAGLDYLLERARAEGATS